MKEIYLAGGCFWGVQEYMSRINGVVETKVGYANGVTSNPSYKEVCMGTTGHAETTYVKYDESIISLEELLNKFWKIIDPTMLNRQGPDIGNQYRTGIYYIDDKDLEFINKTLEEQKTKHTKPIATEIKKLKSFYDAEEYHQDYLKKNPGGYCHIDLSK
ncbi:peptide-methionine (S)-S-oxide reductase [Tissierella praeacuta DSM 18095]|uniref:Peptide methionine sulfoxide reductase MsrA n=1 Tax=Tissierella praeacuta DSM 18095 TaxID=1123404 RepID=A0A1M4S4P2_9FIRM|nr:peptide-methionine (S)-S-oxide reductase MsrA [Tissierella praeacuta]TCU71571.1 peptide-methionine (S)-S-oxide reductase [Tissierella praeacuta]SHE27173.1 peptide-methionine (S)-S-oxide reductase [Tissierella praeacuta DSM 18095]SUP00824.1 Peptide methionine sulfoxide reductase MsrA [Tissierella praeacuta]